MNDLPARALDRPYYDETALSPSYPILTKIVSTLALLILGYYALTALDAWPDTLKRVAFELFIYLIPSPFISVMQTCMLRLGRLTLEEATFRRADYGDMLAKQAALTRIFGHAQLPFALGRVRSLPGVGGYRSIDSDPTFPGLGNWDNSCYQNSVLQGLASLPSFLEYIRTSLQMCDKYGVAAETHHALETLLEQLTESSYQRTVIWTPSVLKSMDSWQQQDAQEYFSRVLEAIEKEALKYARAVKVSSKAGLECLQTPDSIESDTRFPAEPHQTETCTPPRAQLQAQSPLDGMTAQCLVCTTCGYTEGLSLTQFNCLTLNLGLRGMSSIEDLMDDFTAPEEVEGVECDRCTKIGDGAPDGEEPAATSSTGQKAKKSVLRTKAKQITIGRLPKDLVFHINRSIFDDFGNQLKNSAPIRFPLRLNFLSRWCAPLDEEDERIEAVYELKCVVTHYGRHDNGHYVALGKRDKSWYSFNDDIVSAVLEEEVLNRSNGFIFFYEAVTQASSSTASGTLAPRCDQEPEKTEVLIQASNENSIAQDRTRDDEVERPNQMASTSGAGGSSKSASTASDSSSVLSLDGHVNSLMDRPMPVMRTAPDVSGHGPPDRLGSVAVGPAF